VPLLSIESLRVHYEKAEVLRDVSFFVEQGEIVGIIGPNGAGKSTILRAISGIKRPTSGRIFMEGKRIEGMPPHEVVKLGVVHVPEGRMIFSAMTVEENLLMGAYLNKDKGRRKSNMERVFSHFPILRERRRQRAGQLSGGEQQMLAIGRALMTEPRLLLMDEPSMGLSPILVQELSRIIKAINDEGITIVLVEQNARVVFGLARRAYILEVGSIVLEGSTVELARNEWVKKAYLGR
jgi:branched-chain amino acid transport system ATP-binding protein